MESNKSKILRTINSLVVRDALEVPQSFTQNLEYFAEESLIEQFRHAVAEEKQIFNSKSLKPEISIESEPFPLDIGLFNEETQWVISLLSQFLGLDND